MIGFIRASLLVLAAYGTLGLIFAAAFHGRAIARLDPGAQKAGWAFRLLITPGIVALWPLLALRWRRMACGRAFLGEPDSPVSPQRLRASHALAWKMAAVLIPMGIATALWSRPTSPPSQKLPATPLAADIGAAHPR